MYAFSEAENGDVWYYSTPEQFQELLCILDSEEMETPLVRELLEMKQEITRQMAITERLTNQSKGNRKSYIEVENTNIIKQRKMKEEQKHDVELRLDDSKDDVSTIDGDSDVVNEVTIVSDNIHDDDDNHHNSTDDDESRKAKGSKIKNKKNEGKFSFVLYVEFFAFAGIKFYNKFN